jgi:hypothetical protein
MWLFHQFGSLLNLGVCKEYLIMPRAKSPRNGNPRSRVTPPPFSVPDAVTEIRTKGNTVDLESEIRRRAYELYEQRGCSPGQENEDWLVAEREVLARYNQQQSA